MFEILDALKPLILVLFAFGIMFGLASPGKLPRLLAIWIFAPLLIAMILGFFGNAWGQVPGIQNPIVAIVLLLVAVIFVLRLLLGGNLFQNVIGNFIYDALKFIFLLPFRLVRSIARVLFRR